MSLSPTSLVDGRVSTYHSTIYQSDYPREVSKPLLDPSKRVELLLKKDLLLLSLEDLEDKPLLAMTRNLARVALLHTLCVIISFPESGRIIEIRESQVCIEDLKFLQLFNPTLCFLH